MQEYVFDDKYADSSYLLLYYYYRQFYYPVELERIPCQMYTALNDTRNGHVRASTTHARRTTATQTYKAAVNVYSYPMPAAPRMAQGSYNK